MSTPALIPKANSRRCLPPGLYAICDDSVCPRLSLIEKASRLLEGGAQVIQLRMKRTPPGDAVAAARQIVRHCHRNGALCLVNDRVDYAILTQSDGVHVGEDDLPVPAARKLLGPAAIIGTTVRSPEGARRAYEDGADYVGLGPIFPSLTKPVDAPPIGLIGLTRIAAESPLLVVAISGINLANIGAIASAGAHAAAVLSNLVDAEDIALRTRELVQAFAFSQKPLNALGGARR